eukprot:g35834.t1
MATFVSLSDDDPSMELLRLLEQILNPAVEESKGDKPANTEKAKLGPLQKLADKKEYAKLIEKGLFTYAENVFTSSEDEIEAVFTVVYALLGTIFDKAKNKAAGLDLHAKLVTDLAQLLAADPNTAAPLKLKLLSLLFNILDEAWPLRYDVLLSIVQFARASQQSALLVGAFKPLESWVEQWGLAKEQQATLYLAVHNAMAEAKHKQDQAKYRSLFLATVDERCGAQQMEAAAELATEEVRAALAQSALASVDVDSILNLPAVKAMKSSKDQEKKLLVELLSIFAHGTIAEYQKFAKSHGAFLKAQGFDAGEQLQLMRTLALCDLGLVQETVSYARVQQALGLTSTEEVEEAVIQAVVSGRLQAKLDQEEQQVLIETSTKRGFTIEDWHKLGRRLEAWRGSISAVIGSLQQNGTRPIE